MARKLDLHPDRLFPTDCSTRGFSSIPARHGVARRVDWGFLARFVAEHRSADREAADLAHELAGGSVRRAYRIDNPAIAAQAA